MLNENNISLTENQRKAIFTIATYPFRGGAGIRGISKRIYPTDGHEQYRQASTQRTINCLVEKGLVSMHISNTGYTLTGRGWYMFHKIYVEWENS